MPVLLELECKHSTALTNYKSVSRFIRTGLFLPKGKQWKNYVYIQLSWLNNTEADV